MVVDEDTSERRLLQWARILIKVRGWNFPSSLQVVVGSTSYSIQLWWETPPWKSEVHPLQRSRGRGGGIQGMDRSRAPQRVAKVLSMKGASMVLLDDPLISAKGEEGTIPDVMGAVVGTETCLPPAGDGLELSGGRSSMLGQALLGPKKDVKLKSPPLFKAQLDLGLDCPLRRGGKFVFGSFSPPLPCNFPPDRCPSNSSTVLASFEGPNPCTSTLMVSMAALKPLVDDVLLEEVLRFQGTLSSSCTSWEEGPSPSSPF